MPLCDSGSAYYGRVSYGLLDFGSMCLNGFRAAADLLSGPICFPLVHQLTLPLQGGLTLVSFFVLTENPAIRFANQITLPLSFEFHAVVSLWLSVIVIL